MFQMAPEDRLRNVLHYQEEQRRQAALERMARAAPSKPVTEPSPARDVGSSGSHELWLAATRLLHTFTGTRGMVRRGAR